MDVKQVVQTVFTAAGVSSFTSSLGSVSTAAGGAGAALGMMSSILGGIGAAAGAAGIGMLGKKIIDVSSNFEQGKNIIAGFLSSLDFTKDYASGLKQADSVLNKIIADSAKLPGEAEDYIEVFKAGLPAVAAASGKNLADITKFTNQLAAAASTLGVRSDEAGVDLQRMLAAGQGTAIIRSPLMRQLLTFMHKIPGEANLTVAAFNKMTERKRFDLLEKTLVLFGPTLNQAASSWDAMSGAFASNTRMLLRLAGAPIFDLAKKTLGQVNDLIMDADGNLTPFANKVIYIGNLIGTHLSSMFEGVLDHVKALVPALENVGDTILRNKGFQALGRGLANVGAAAKTTFSGIAAGLRSAVTSPTGVAVATRVGPMEVFGKRFEMFTRLLEPAGKLLGTLAGYAGDLGQLFLQMQDAVNIVIEPIFKFGGMMLGIYNMVLTKLRPTFQRIETALSHLWHSVANVLNPVLRILFKIIGVIVKYAAMALVPALKQMGRSIAWVIERLSDLLDWIGKKLGKVADKFAPAGAEGPSIWDQFSGLWDQLQKAADEKTDAAATKTPKAPAGAGVYQDFRGSKFDITQKFAEGYDPDRIAVSFAQDIGRIGELPLQSGHEPAMGTR